MARALRDLGVSQPYVLQGGFQSMARSGVVEIKTGTTVYESGTLKVVADETEYLLEQAQQQLADRNLQLALAAGLTLGGFAVYNYHYTLEFIGVLGPLLTLARRAMGYSGIQDAVDDLSNVGQALGQIGAGVSRLAEGAQKLAKKSDA